MKAVFKPGDQKEFRKKVTSADVAAFGNQIVHSVYATFSLALDAEWATRQFVLEMKDEHEEGIGTFLSIEHKNPAFVGDEIIFTAWVDHIEGNELICFYEAKVGSRLVALGRTGQKILSRDKLEVVFDAARQG
jgi:fluoroacetyl-CoA thioesterase